MILPNVNKKRVKNKEVDNKTDKKFDKKAHLEELGLKQEV